MTLAEQIKAAIRCDEYASRFLDVKNNVAICCFHDEKTPSLRLHPEYYKCFGCGASGDVIAFAARYHGVSVSRAFALLAREAGIDSAAPPPSPRERYLRDREREEAGEWMRQVRASLIAARNSSWDCGDSIAWYDSEQYLRFAESIRGDKVRAAYREQRTPQQAAILRASAAANSKPTATSILREFLQWSR